MQTQRYLAIILTYKLYDTIMITAHKLLCIKLIHGCLIDCVIIMAPDSW